MNFLLDDLKSAFEDKKLVDVSFLVGYDAEDIERIGANSVILRLRSPVFETQFSEPWTIKKDQSCSTTSESSVAKNSNNEIKIPDANPAAFRSFLKYLYTGELDIPKVEDVVGVYYLGVKYDVGHLIPACLEFIEENLQIDNVLQILEEATLDLYKNLDQIQQLCLKYFTLFSKQLINSEFFLSVGVRVLQAIVNYDVLGITETQLCSRIFAWGLAECERQSIEDSEENIRRVLEPDVFYNIRFLSISDSKLSGGLASIIWGPDGILTNEEQFALLRLEKTGVGKVDNFNTNARQVRNYCFVERVSATEPFDEEDAVEMNKEINKCTFLTSHDVQLIGFGFFGAYSASKSKYEIMIQVTNPASRTTEASLTCKRVCAEPGKLIRVFLEKPIIIIRGVLYTIYYSIKGPSTYVGDGNPKTNVITKNFLKDNQDFSVEFVNTSYHQLPLFCFGSG